MEFKISVSLPKFLYEIVENIENKNKFMNNLIEYFYRNKIIISTIENKRLGCYKSISFNVSERNKNNFKVGKENTNSKTIREYLINYLLLSEYQQNKIKEGCF